MMSRVEEHLAEMELSCMSDSGGIREGADHLRRCARCQNVAAEYRWLQEQVGMALATAAEAAPVSRPRWRAVRRRLRVERQRRIAGWRASVVGSAVLAVCVILSFSPVFGAAVAQTVYPAKATLPDPPSPAVIESVGPTLATPTPVTHPETTAVGASAPTLLIPLPTPLAEPET